MSTFTKAPGMPLTRTVLPDVDFQDVFAQSLHMQLLLDPSFIILAVTDAYLTATMTRREEIIGHHLFEIFPDNPDHGGADGVLNLRRSLVEVLNTRRPHEMDVQRYDVRRPPGGGPGFETRYWKPVNAPVLGADGFVRYIVHQVEDVTAKVL
jgi:hypothetical protein